MDRNESGLAIVINTEKVGESDRLVTLLSPTFGLIKVKIHAASKSKKVVKAPLYIEGNFNLYHNRERKNYSLVDITPIALHDEISNDYNKVIIAAMFSELIMVLKGSDYEASYSLYSQSLDYLCDDNVEAKTVAVQFLIKFLQIFGLSTDYINCPLCDKKYKDDEILGFSTLENVPCCQNCDNINMQFVLPPNARAYIAASLNSPFNKGMQFSISSRQRDRVLNYLIKYVKTAIEVPLKSINMLVRED